MHGLARIWSFAVEKKIFPFPQKSSWSEKSACTSWIYFYTGAQSHTDNVTYYTCFLEVKHVSEQNFEMISFYFKLNIFCCWEHSSNVDEKSNAKTTKPSFLVFFTETFCVVSLAFQAHAHAYHLNFGKALSYSIFMQFKVVHTQYWAEEFRKYSRSLKTPSKFECRKKTRCYLKTFKRAARYEDFWAIVWTSCTVYHQLAICTSQE